MNIYEQVSTNIFWVDVFAFSLLIILILFLWISNHIYLQFFTAFCFINIGILSLAWPFLEEEILIAKNWTVARIDDDNLALLVSIFIQNPLFIEIILFSLVFIFSLLLSAVLYLAFIKTKHFISFSIISLKLNFWKLLYIPFLVLGIAYLVSLIIPLTGVEVAKKSKFINFMYQVKLNKLTERKSYIPTLKWLKASVKELIEVLENKDAKPEDKRKVFLESVSNLPVFGEYLKEKFLDKAEISIVNKSLFDKLISSYLDEKEKEEVTEKILERLNDDSNKELRKKLDDALGDQGFIDKLKEVQNSFEYKSDSLIQLLPKIQEIINN